MSFVFQFGRFDRLRRLLDRSVVAFFMALVSQRTNVKTTHFSQSDPIVAYRRTMHPRNSIAFANIISVGLSRFRPQRRTFITVLKELTRQGPCLFAPKGVN
jgi:hypothetical protein